MRDFVGQLTLWVMFAGATIWTLSCMLRRSTRLPSGRVVYADTSNWSRVARPLFSRAHRLSGKPDYVMQDGARIVPVELKSSRAPRNGPREGHVLQLMAYCLLVETVEKVAVQHGIVQYSDKTFQLKYTERQRDSVIAVLETMRADLARSGSHRNHRDANRCQTCGVRHACDERIG